MWLFVQRIPALGLVCFYINKVFLDVLHYICIIYMYDFGKRINFCSVLMVLCAFSIRNPGCNEMCSMCYRKFVHTQPSKDPAPSTGASDLKVSAAMPEGQPTKILHNPHPLPSPEHTDQTLQSSIPMAASKTSFDQLSSPLVTGAPTVPEGGHGSSQAQKMEVDEQKVLEVFCCILCFFLLLLTTMCHQTKCQVSEEYR